jgi:hypothetical protein
MKIMIKIMIMVGGRRGRFGKLTAGRRPSSWHGRIGRIDQTDRSDFAPRLSPFDLLFAPAGGRAALIARFCSTERWRAATAIFGFGFGSPRSR